MQSSQSLSPSTNPSENPNGKPDPNPSLVPSLNPSSNPLDSSSLMPLPRDDEDDDNNDDDDEIEDGEEDNDDFDLIDVEGMSKYKVLCLRKIRRNEVRLASLGFLGGMSSAASPSSNRPNRKKRVATQDDVVKRVQPKRNVKIPTSYKDLDDSVISKRMQPIDSLDMGEEDTVSKRMRYIEYEDKAEHSRRRGQARELQ